jgi:eukaryotic-like serine/threonine-protein kinase
MSLSSDNTAPFADCATRPEAELRETGGANIGPYKLLEKIGEGGFGEVWLAEQKEPVKRRVAVKIIKLGMDTRQVVARFEAERQALALMDHPNIAKVLDAGATELGRPYFVMEHVKGVPITNYCRTQKLDTTARLHLFIQICRAIQHAHQKGIIHRDIKPSNILVSIPDSQTSVSSVPPWLNGQPIPKVIDFGIAKATQMELTEKTIHTQLNQFIGTPAYMSPEQAEMTSLDIDTRSDIYSLGVLLYELLTGTTPFDTRELLSAGLDEMRRIIREREPLRPSTRLSKLLGDDVSLTSPSAPRDDLRGANRDSSRRLLHAIDPDLDWIVLKCLEKDRTRRYESASGLAADLQRHLANQPVTARPPSASYQFRKFARRNKGALVTAGALIVGLVLTLASLAVSTFRIAGEQRKTAKALHAETRAKDELSNVLARERLDAYFHRITLAHRELSADNLGEALKLLEDCPEALRRWEWNFLARAAKVDPLLLRGPTSPHAVAFHPDGRHVAGGCSDGSVEIWDVSASRVVKTLRGHDSYVFSVAFSPDGRRAASASADRTIRLWDLDAGFEIFKKPGHIGDLVGMAYAVALSPDGRHLAAGQEDGSAVIWDAGTGREVKRLPGHENTAGCLAFSTDGRLFVTGSWGGVVRVWDADTYQLRFLKREHTHRITALAFHPNGQWLATASFDRTIKIWDLRSGDLLHDWRAHPSGISGLAFTPGGERLFSIGVEDKNIKIWDPLIQREVLNLRGHTVWGSSLAASSDGLRLASAGRNGIRIWDAASIRPTEGLEFLSREHDDEVWSVAYSLDGQSIASASWTGPVRIWDVRDGNLLRSLPKPQNVGRTFHVAFSPDSLRVLAAGHSAQMGATVTVWEIATGLLAFDQIRENSVPFFAAFDPSGRFIIREGPDHTIQLRQADTGQFVGIVGRHDRQIWGMAFSPDRQHLATASNDDTVRIWRWDPARLDPSSQPELTLPVPPRGYAQRLAFSADGAHLATGGADQLVMIWDAKSGRNSATLRAHTRDVLALAFSPDGRWLASAGEDTTIRIWNAKTFSLFCTLRGHTAMIGSLAFSPDSKHLVSGSRDRTMKIWHAARWEEAAGPP